jgi:hypothetical protein
MNFVLKCGQNRHKREILLKHYHVHKRPSLDSVLSRMNPVKYILNFRYYVVPKNLCKYLALSNFSYTFVFGEGILHPVQP